MPVDLSGVTAPVFKALLPKLEGVRGWKIRALTITLALLPLVVLAVAIARAPAMLSRPTNAAEFWTLVQGVAATMILGATLALGVVGWYGLRSLKLARHDMVVRATREARGLALQRAEEFSQRIIRDGHASIQAELQTANVAQFTTQVASGSAVFDDAAMYATAKNWWAAVPPALQTRIIYFMNDLEAWAMYFTHELADGEVVFGPCAPTFCAIVVHYAPWVIVARREQYAGFYPNIVGLFRAWRAELDAKERGTAAEAWKRAAQATEERLAQHRLAPPLGTRVDM